VAVTRGDSRTGFSTKRIVSQAGTPDAVTRASFTGQPTGPDCA
jgi:hypothetical protein